MKNKFPIAVIAALITLPLVASAADEKKGGGFAALDKNGDGKISKEEFMASPSAQKDSGKAESRFKALDTNNDGFLSKEEYAAGQKKKKS
jgi:Ca2+-binding EF-hand superfamily protein